MYIGSIRCNECGCNVAWGEDPMKDPDAETVARDEFLAAQRARQALADQTDRGAAETRREGAIGTK